MSGEGEHGSTSVRLDGTLRTREGAAPHGVQPSDASAESLRPVIADLDRLNHHTEQGFMNIGAKLAEFMQTVGAISSELAILSNAELGQKASMALTHALDRSTRMTAVRGGRDGGLAGMRREVGLLKRTLSAFQESVATFRTLGLLTRIETARLGSTGADFSDLADDVSLLAGQVQSKVAGALSIADSLIPPIESAMHEIAALDEEQTKDLPALVSGTLASLSSFREVQDKAQESSHRLRTQYDAISDAFKKLIVSIQFHDITRQQVEHVVEVLQRLSSNSGEDDGSPSRHPRGTSAVLALQSAQLADAESKFSASVEVVERNLDGIATNVLRMAEESRALSGFRDDGNGSFFLPMEQDCGAILASLSRTADAEAATLATRRGLANTIQKMSGSIQEIQQVETRMRRMALNARISAFHLGDAGSALDVLAGSVQQLASECGERSTSLVASLGAMSNVAESPGEEDGRESVGELGDPYVEELRRAVADLHSSTEKSFALISQIVARGERLSANIDATRRDFTVGTLFSETAARARKSMKQIADKIQLHSPLDGSDEQESGLADFMSHYTMQSEVDVHQNVARAAGGVVPVVVAVERQISSTGAMDELGENVEFF